MTLPKTPNRSKFSLIVTPRLAALACLTLVVGCLADPPAVRPPVVPDAPTEKPPMPPPDATSPLHHLYDAPRTPSAAPPLLVLLHGIGSDEHDLYGLARQFDPRLAVLSVRAPFSMGRGAYAWFNVQFRPGGHNVIDEPQWESATKQLESTIDQLVAKHGLDPKRVFLFGFSQGGMMAGTLALLHPERYAGAILHSTRLLPQLETRRAPDAALKGFPLLVLHGTADDRLPIEHGRALRDALQPRGVALTYAEFPIVHTISEDSLAAAGKWIRERLGP